VTIVIGGADACNEKVKFIRAVPGKSAKFCCAIWWCSCGSLPDAIDENSGNGHVSSNGHGESLAAGFLVLDASLRPIYASEEALAILAYPGVPPKNKALATFY